MVDGTVINQTYTQDNVDNVTGATDTVNASNTFTATYTNSEQLTDFTNSGATRTYLQDTKFNVNRITPFNPSTSALYYTLSNNKISNLVYGSAYKYPVFDTKGNMTSDGNGGTFTYDLANNMVTASKINSGAYKYNALHQRVEKAVTVGGVTKTYYIYNTNGSLLGEYDASGNVIAEHVYLKNIPVAVVKGANTYFVHTDYLNTPRAISNSSGTVVWKWDNVNAYGYNSANETVSGTAFEYNPRFAGQYFDKETGLHYNLNRMYNPQLARYMQPDPIGVNGGMNIYSYVENNPLNATDRFGLDVTTSISGKNLTITIPINIVGSTLGTYLPTLNTTKGALLAGIMEKNINSAWGGEWKYGTCNLLIKSEVNYNKKGLNTISIIDSGPIKRSSVNGRVLSDRIVDVNDGTFDIRYTYKGKNGEVVPDYIHEVGHLMGLIDRYSDVNGVSEAFPGWSNNIMGNNLAKPEQRDINMLIDINFSKEQIKGCGC